MLYLTSMYPSPIVTPSLAPIVLFVYNRLEHTQQTIRALLANHLASESDLLIYSDGPKDLEGDARNVQAVRSYLHQVQGMKSITIILREKNLGLAANIISGVSEVVERWGRVIVLEDDLVTSPFFLQYVNDGLEMYAQEERVASIHGYVYPLGLEQKQLLPETFFLRGADCWGWGTWQRAWRYFEADGNKLLAELEEKKLQGLADFNNSYGYTKMLKEQIRGINNSWAIRWYFSAFLSEMLTLYPKESLVLNIGNDGSGTHCGSTEVFSGLLQSQKVSMEKQLPVESKIARESFTFFYKKRKWDIRDILEKVRGRWKKKLKP